MAPKSSFGGLYQHVLRVNNSTAMLPHLKLNGSISDLRQVLGWLNLPEYIIRQPHQRLSITTSSLSLHPRRLRIQICVSIHLLGQPV